MARILIIDDNETMREGLGATVRRMGHEAVLASSGVEGRPARERPRLQMRNCCVFDPERFGDRHE